MPASDIVIKGAREHNLQNVDLVLPRNKLICLTGVSGSGKSSLAFDTLYAEGQRRYVESLSTFARQFLGQMPKPDVDFLSGLSPSISISQKSSGRNPRSTVGTITEIYDYLRVLFARVGTGHCPKCGQPITAQTRDQIIARIAALPAKTKFAILAPVTRQQKGEFRDLFRDLLRQGYVRARVDGSVVQLTDELALDRQMRHNIEVVVDRLSASRTNRSRLAEAVESALKVGQGNLIVAVEAETAGSTPTPPGGTTVAGRRASRKARSGLLDGDIAMERCLRLQSMRDRLRTSLTAACSASIAPRVCALSVAAWESSTALTRNLSSLEPRSVAQGRLYRTRRQVERSRTLETPHLRRRCRDTRSGLMVSKMPIY